MRRSRPIPATLDSACTFTRYIGGPFPPVSRPPASAAPGPDRRRPPIGVTDAPVRQVTTLALQPGAVLCMFTDGLVERRYEPIDDGINRLCQVVTPGPPEGVCVSVMHDLVGRQYPGDNIALLVLRWLREQAPASTMPAQG